MTRKTTFRLLVMIACPAGIAYGASQISQLPAGPRELVGRIGKWLQAQADTVVEHPKTGRYFAVPNRQAEAVDAPGWESEAPAEPDGSEALPFAVNLALPSDPLDRPAPGESEVDLMALRLRELGATHYQLEKWGADERLFRFTCEVAVGGESALRQHFEAVADSSTDAISRVIEQVSRLSRTR